MDVKPHDWQLAGTEPMTRKQQKMLNAVCGDLQQINWHGHRLDKDDWRHTLAGTVLGFRFVPGINTGHGAAGMVMLGRSSLDMSKTQAAEAINMGLDIGDRPEDQGLRCKPIQWSDVVLLGQGFNPRDFREAA